MISVSLRPELFSYNHFDFRNTVAFLKSGKSDHLLSALQLYVLAARCQSSFAWCVCNSCVSEQEEEQITEALDKYKERKAVKCISVNIYLWESTIRQGIQKCKNKHLPEMCGVLLRMFWRRV